MSMFSKVSRLALVQPPRRRQGGLTLIELIVFIVIISVALTGILVTFNTVVRSSADPLVSRQLQAIAEAMLEEVLLQDFKDPSNPLDPGAVVGKEESRALFDNVDDYQNFGKDIVGITDARGESVPNLGADSAYGVLVQVVDVPSWVGANAKLIKVTASRSGQQFVLSGYRTQDPEDSTP